MALKAIFFDVDGTLADTEQQGHLPAYNAAFQELGLTWRWSAELYRDELLLLPGGRERIRYYILRHHPPLGSYKAEADRDLGAWVNSVHAAKSRWFRRRLESGQVTLRPGVRRLITEAKNQGIRLAIVTNASERSLKPFLNHTLGRELRDAIDFVVSGEQVEHKKPSPDLYLRAMGLMELTPAACVAVEDSAMGLCAAAGAGLRTLITINSDTQFHDFGAATAVVDTLGEPDRPWQILRGPLNGHRWASPDALSALLCG